MYKARFLYDIYEEKYSIYPYFGGEWQLSDEYLGVSFSLGYRDNNVMRYVRLKEGNVILHEEDLSIEFRVGNEININDEILKLTRVVKNLDGSIDYHTDKKEYISLNTIDTYFDERPKQEKEEERLEPMEYSLSMDEVPKPPKDGEIRYFNDHQAYLVGDPRNDGFIKRMIRKIKGV